MEQDSHPPGAPAVDARTQQGDIILRMGDTPVNQDMPSINALSRLTPGQTIPVVLDRDGK
ncbi:MAG: PDZ domain-containing protein [Dehalococcoidia bacterium]|jgi:S1-C subfamily serine protease